MARPAEQLRWLMAGLSLLACFLVGALPSGYADVAGSGFLARAQDAELVVVGRVIGMSVGLFGCGHTIAVEKVLRGSVEGDRIKLSSPGDCPVLPFGHRFVFALEANPNDLEFMMDTHPPGTSWRVFLGGDESVYGDLTRCHGVTVAQHGRSANAPEKMRLEELATLLSATTHHLCGFVQPEAKFETRAIAGQVLDLFGSPTWAHLELVPAGHHESRIGISTDELGRFRFSDVPRGSMWLQSPDKDFDPFLLPPHVTQVSVVIPMYSYRAQVSAY